MVILIYLFNDFFELIGTDTAEGAFIILRQLIVFDLDFIVAHSADKLFHADSSVLLFRHSSQIPVKDSWQVST